MNVGIFCVDPGRLAVMVHEVIDQDEVKEFILLQDEIDFVEYSGRFYYPEGRSHPLVSSTERIALEVKKGWRTDL